MPEERCRARLGAATNMPPGEARTEQVREIVRHAEAAADDRLLVDARRELLYALTEHAQVADRPTAVRLWGETLVATARFHALRSRMSQYFEDFDWVLQWAATQLVVDMISKSALRPVTELYTFLDDMKGLCRPGHGDLAELEFIHAELEQCAGELAAAEERVNRVERMVLPEHWGAERVPVLKLDIFSAQGQEEDAIGAIRLLVEPAQLYSTEGEHRLDPFPALLLPYLRTGQPSRAREAYHHIFLTEPWVDGYRLEFLARSGNEDRALQRLRQDPPTAGPVRFSHDMEYAAAVALVCRRLTGLGHGQETFPVRTGDAAPARTVTAAEYQAESAGNALDFAHQFDACNGTTYQSERMRARIHAEPVVDHLPLSSTVIS